MRRSQFRKKRKFNQGGTNRPGGKRCRRILIKKEAAPENRGSLLF
ncbi:hypothetical protein DCCM_3716 [Desulfocucumis palustris]|uniref:Uncharacterized protein n=1 Tax=Desulfocucumis palustris TaxID=1898651 RepID=A0A2L2XE22_9FIRM|nr:hypothetical protein DCCM_3716 [Desulfocucumis palustris]